MRSRARSATVQNKINAIGMWNPHSVDIIVIYVRPGVEKEAFRDLMEDVGRSAKYSFMIAGDFNALHEILYTKNKPNGKIQYE